MAYPLTITDHPLAAHKLTLLREDICDSTKARQLLYELGLMLAIEGTRNFNLIKWRGTTYEGEPFEGAIMEQLNVVMMPVIRSGLVLGEAFAAILPSARTGHLGIHHDYLNESPAVTYLVSIPNAPDLTDFFIIDSLIGTGETMKMAVNELRELGVDSRQIRIAVLSVHEQGLAAFYDEPNNASIPIYALERRSEVDEQGLPVFGFGNTADRIYGTGAAA